MTIPAPDYITQIAPYQAGKPISELAREYGLDAASIVKLASNENPLGMPDSARAAIAATLVDLERYPDSNGFELKAAISRRYSVPASAVTLGNGSNDILDLVCRALVQRGDSVVYSQYSFAVYMLASQAVGAHGIMVPATAGLGHDLPAMADAVRPDTRVVFVANPNNPTGTFEPGKNIKHFLETVPADVVVVLDQAYDEYLAPQDRYDATAWLREHDNLIISRTFSKAYGLAGLRIGFGLASDRLTDLMNRVRQPFNTSLVAQAAAVAVMNDADYLARSYELNLAQRERLQNAFAAMGLQAIDSRGNFVLVRVGDAPDSGAVVTEKLLRAGVIVRPVGNYGLPQWIRVSVGLEQENTVFLKALAAILQTDG